MKNIINNPFCAVSNYDEDGEPLVDYDTFEEVAIWLKKATKFELENCIYHNRPLAIEQRKQMKGEPLWVLKMHEWCLGKDGVFHYEPRPSSRDDDFINMTRFNSPEECLACYSEKITDKQDLYIN